MNQLFSMSFFVLIVEGIQFAQPVKTKSVKTIYITYQSDSKPACAIHSSLLEISLQSIMSDPIGMYINHISSTTTPIPPQRCLVGESLLSMVDGRWRADRCKTTLSCSALVWWHSWRCQEWSRLDFRLHPSRTSNR